MNNVRKATITSFSGPPKDEALVIAAKNGNGHAFEILVDRHQEKILAVALRYTRVRQDAEDVVQQSLQKAFVHLSRFEGKSSFATWLTRIAVNEALMMLRKERLLGQVPLDYSSEIEDAGPRLEIPDTRPDPETSCLRQEWVRILSATMVKLRPSMRKAIELRELRELSIEDTAQRMGLSVAAAKGRLFHGKRKLREKLMRYMTAPRKKGQV